MTSEHIAEVIEFMDRESKRVTSEHMKKLIEFVDRKYARKRTKEEIIEDWKEVGLLDSNGNYTPPYRNLGRWIEEYRRRLREEQTAPAL